MRHIKIFILLALCVIALFLAGCSTEFVYPNHISPTELTDEQQDLMSLLTAHGNEILIFDYVTAEAFEHVEFWLETYHYGTLIEQIQGVHLIVDATQPQNGQLAIIINRDNSNQYSQWTFVVRQSGGVASNRFESLTIEVAGTSRGFGSITESVAIQNNTEIILYISKFSRDGLRTYSDMQTFVEQPELLAEYPYVQIIKARFS